MDARCIRPFAVAVFCVTYTLILPALTLEAAVACGLEEHIHGDECWMDVSTLICGLKETETVIGHEYSESCYTPTLICQIPESEGHSHSEVCFDENGNAVCGLEESAGHIHTEECYTYELTCGFEETQSVSGHVHGESCYKNERVLVC